MNRTVPVPSRRRGRVLVLGAGPAGCAAALALARRGGTEVLLLERRLLPRPKTCAGGLAPWTLELLRHLGLEAALAPLTHVIRGVTLWTPRGDPLRLRGKHTAGVLERCHLDTLLARSAQQAGAMIREGATAKALLRQRGRVVGVRTSAGELEADAVIVATGAGCAPEYAPPRRNRLFGIMARYAGVEGTTDELELFLDREVLPHYAWVFPEGAGRANLGLCFRASSGGPSPRGLLARFIQRHLASRLRHADQVGRVQAHPIDATLWPPRLVEPGALFAGEAARLADPLSGEGIFHALLSGTLAGEHLSHVLSGEGRPTREALQPYARAVRRRLIPRAALSSALLALIRSPLAHLPGRLLTAGAARRILEQGYAWL